MFLSDLLNEIKTGKYNFIIFVISFIFLFHIYNHMLTCNKKIENMSNASDIQIREAVKRYYSSDEFIRNISVTAAQKPRNGLQINGDLNVTGQITATGEISNNNFSFSSLNNRINSIQR
jgi:hypothetical protein